MADAMEIILLSFLSPILKPIWDLKDYQESILSSVVFAGMFVGAFFWGWISDRVGRKISLFCSLIFTFIFGILSAFVPSFWYLVAARLFVGFGVSGAHVSFSLFSEFCTTKTRGVFMMLFEFFWVFGTVSQSGLAWLFLGTNYFGEWNFRYLIGVTALPCLLVLGFLIFLPESPRYYLVTGKPEKAKTIFERIAKCNKRKMPEGELIVKQETHRGNIFLMCSKKLFKRSFLSIFIWFAMAFCYYGVIILTPKYFQVSGNQANLYLETFITSAAEIPGIIVGALLINVIGRKNTIALMFSICGVFLLCLMLKANVVILTIFAVISRAAIMGAFSVLYIYTPESVPTIIRSAVLGTCASVSRLGGAITPFISNMLITFDKRIPVVIYGVVCFIAAFCSFILPDTMGKNLEDTMEETH